MQNSKHDIDKAYVSPYDRFLYEFDSTHPKSASQLKEINKFKRIFARRDNAKPTQDMQDVWTGF